MKKTLFLTNIILCFSIITLTACSTQGDSAKVDKEFVITDEAQQAYTKAPSLLTNVFENQELRISISYPENWDVRLNLEMRGLLVVDDFDTYRKNDKSAYESSIGILILVLDNELGSSKEILGKIQERMKALGEPNNPVTVENNGNQEFSWAEYTVQSQNNGDTIHYFLAVTSNGKKAASAMTIVYPKRQDQVREFFRNIVLSIKFQGD